jgi:hypothetical protein
LTTARGGGAVCGCLSSFDSNSAIRSECLIFRLRFDAGEHLLPFRLD